MLALWEGAICAVLFFPVAITFASLGGIIGGFFRPLEKGYANEKPIGRMRFDFAAISHPS